MNSRTISPSSFSTINTWWSALICIVSQSYWPPLAWPSFQSLLVVDSTKYPSTCSFSVGHHSCQVMMSLNRQIRLDWDSSTDWYRWSVDSGSPRIIPTRANCQLCWMNGDTKAHLGPVFQTDLEDFTIIYCRNLDQVQMCVDQQLLVLGILDEAQVVM